MIEITLLAVMAFAYALIGYHAWTKVVDAASNMQDIEFLLSWRSGGWMPKLVAAVFMMLWPLWYIPVLASRGFSTKDAPGDSPSAMPKQG